MARPHCLIVTNNDHSVNGIAVLLTQDDSGKIRVVLFKRSFPFPITDDLYSQMIISVAQQKYSVPRQSLALLNAVRRVM